MRKPFYLHRGFIGWSGIGRAPEAMYFILYLLYIHKKRPSPMFLLLIAVSFVTWDVYYANIFRGFLDYVRQARM